MILFLASNASAASHGITDFEAWRLVQFTKESGLPSFILFQAGTEQSDGTLWCSSSNGLVWFDGYRWQAPPMLGTLNIGENPGADSGSSGVFLRANPNLYFGGKKGMWRLPLNNVSQAYPLGPRTVLAISDSTLMVYDHGKIFPFDPLPSEHGRCINFWHPAGGSIWINTEHGLYRVDNGRWKLVIPAVREPFYVAKVCEDASHEIVAAIRSPYYMRGIWEWSADQVPKRRPVHMEDVVRCLDMDDSGRVIVAYQSGFIEYRDASGWRELPGFARRFPGMAEFQFRPDGDLIIMTNDADFLYRTALSRWTYVRHEVRGPWDRINDLLLTSSKELWTATAAGVEFRRPDGTTRSFSSIAGEPLYEITGLAEDKDGGVWISSGSTITGAYRWDGSTWTHFVVTSDSAAVHFHRIKKDLEQNLWFLGIPSASVYPEGSYLSSREGPGAYVLHKGKFEHWGVDQGLLSGKVYSFGEAHDGSYWFGSSNSISKWHNGQWQYWTPANGLSAQGAFSIAIDRQDRAWIADRSEDVGVIEEKKPPQYFTEEDGLSNGEVWDIAAGDSGEIWAGTNNGLNCYSHGDWTTYNESFGLSKNEVWPVAVYGNDIYAGTAGEGVAILHETRNTPPPIVVADSAIVQERQALVAWRAFSYWSETPPSDVLTRSRLDGGVWTSWSNHHQWTADGLLSGRHQLQIEAKSAEGSISLPMDVAFATPPPFYLRESFTIPVYGSLIILVCVGGYYQFRKRRLDKTLDTTIDKLEASRKEVLYLGRELTATEERERLRVSSYLHDSVLQSLNFIKLGIQMVNAEIITPVEKATLEKVLSQVERAMADTQSVTFELTPKVLEGEDFAYAIEWLAERLEREHGRRIEVSAEHTEYNIPRPARTLLFRGARELILNSFKHSKALTIKLTMQVRDQELILTVVDDGVGYSPENILRDVNQPGRMGLFQLRERLAYFGGRLETESAPGKGTKATLILALDGTKQLSGIS
jgi:signal transduction histidine kinase/ligand-binding sensor domain-containing protein